VKAGRGIALATLCAAIPLAQARANSDTNYKVRENAKVRKTVFQYAACVIKNHHERAADAILSDAENSDILKHYPELISSSCMGNVAGSVEMKFGGDLYRYALADALVNADFAMEGPADFADRLPLAHISEVSESEQDTIKKRNSIALLSRYGECVVRRDPVDVRFWILTKPDVPEESSRINALKPAFSACLTNGTVTFNRTTMRGLVALNYYRLAKATPQPGLGKAH